MLFPCYTSSGDSHWGVPGGYPKRVEIVLESALGVGGFTRDAEQDIVLQIPAGRHESRKFSTQAPGGSPAVQNRDIGAWLVTTTGDDGRSKVRRMPSEEAAWE